MRKILILTMMTGVVACGPLSSSSDDDVKRCDVVAEKYVEAFADEETVGRVRAQTLEDCVLSPEDETNDQREAWLTCSEAAGSGGELIKCKKVFEHDSKKAALEAFTKLSRELFIKTVCEQKPEDELKEQLEKLEELQNEAREAGADSKEIEEAGDLFGDKPFEEGKAELCKGTKPAAEAGAAEAGAAAEAAPPAG